MMFRSAKRATVFAAVLASAALVTAACSSQGGAQNSGAANAPAGGTAPGGQKYTIAMVTHAPPGDTFWDKIQSGAQAAATQLGVDLKYSNDPDSGPQATLVQNAIDSKVDAIAVSLAYPDAVGPVLKKASDAGIPTVAFNAGLDQYQKYGAKMYFGSDEDVAGQAVGTRLSRSGGTGKAICVIQEQGNVALETRCAGVAKTYPNVEILQVNGRDLPSVQQTIGAKLQEDPSIGYVVTLGADYALAAAQSVSSGNSQAKIATFDLNKDTAQAIKDGKVLFAVDQQPYLQGFMSVQMLWLNLTNGNDLGGGKAVLTGPSYVDSANIDKILQFANNNTR
ncbi:substrate-binding domain-containing protein [Pseudonocardia xishanensis]|uniref:Substrate-binding domain-containing protein n=1 Tax=Pseudonocardia xishanensis TaxID=630995 RepID=A0ABP8RVL8_9PSEU